jgi:hypothetical protein
MRPRFRCSVWPGALQLAPHRRNDPLAPEIDLAQHRLLVEIAELGLERDVRRFQHADFLEQAVDHLIDASHRQILSHRFQRHVVRAGRFLDQVAVLALGATKFEAFRHPALEAGIVEIGHDFALIVAGIAAAQEAKAGIVD